MVFDRPKYKQFALQQLNGRWKTAVLGTLICLAIGMVFSIPESQFSYSYEDLQNLAGMSLEQMMEYFGMTRTTAVLQFLFSVISQLVSFIINIALAHLWLVYSRSPDPVSLKVLFEGFNKWGRGILAGLWQLLWLIIWGLLCCVIFIAVAFPFAFIIKSSEAFISISPLLFIICCIPLLIKSIEYSHLFYLVAEFPELGIRKALTISKLITKGHRMEIFITYLTFIGWVIVGIVTFFIGFLWISPYLNMTYINIYHALLKDALETGKVLPEDLN
ncbi:MAG: DUF975 family protein [Treponema sp.]|nr:DUF975 family protein [Treponema sp.]